MCTQVVENKVVRVAVLDSGCNLHKDLKANIKRRISLLTYDNSNNPNDLDDKNGHGTFVCGIIVNIAKKADIISIKVANKDGSTNYKLITQGIYCAVLEGCHVINISLGGNYYDKDLHDAVKYATSRNVPVICAAGNDGHMFNANLIDYPAKFPETIAVGGIDSLKNIAVFSTIGKEIDFVAPSVDIWSASSLNSYKKMSGTSFAAPHVSGIVARYKLQNNSEGKTTREIKELLRGACIDLGEEGKDVLFGYGEINTKKLLQKNTGIIRGLLLRVRSAFNFLASIFN